MSLSRNVTGGEFQRHGPAMEKLLSPRRVLVLRVTKCPMYSCQAATLTDWCWSAALHGVATELRHGP